MPSRHIGGIATPQRAPIAMTEEVMEHILQRLAQRINRAPEAGVDRASGAPPEYRASH